MKTTGRLMSISLFIAGAILFFAFSNSEQEKVTYKSTKIGNQEWMTTNLNVSTFRNGDPITNAKTVEEWDKASREGLPAWCYYDSDPTNEKKYGKLYNWYAVNDARGLAPEGWHVPNDTELTQLTDFLGGLNVAGIKIKSTEGWSDNANGTNESGFSALPGGFRDYDGSFQNLTKVGYWWSSTESDNAVAWMRSLWLREHHLSRFTFNKEYGLSVRCIKD